jgi:hypothetical protein
VTVIVGKDFAQAQVTAPAASGAPSTSASPSAH